jgi:hypothetical protein
VIQLIFNTKEAGKLAIAHVFKNHRFVYGIGRVAGYGIPDNANQILGWKSCQGGHRGDLAVESGRPP